jgi:hypothetical protein
MVSELRGWRKMGLPGLTQERFIDLKEVHRQQQFHKLDADQIVRAIAPT